jgi:putative chitinase
MNVTKEQLVKMGASSMNAMKYVQGINLAIEKYEINSNARLCGFIAQLFEESGDLRVVKEDLNYSPERLCAVWPSRFPTLPSANLYGHNPDLLAEKVYGGRFDNPVGKAKDFIGRGLIQVTGFSNYKACGDSLELDLITHPDLLEIPDYSCLSAGWFWSKTNCNRYADMDNEEGVRLVTKIVNGGYGNLQTRISNWHKAKNIFTELKLVNEVVETKPISEVKEIVEIKPVEEPVENPVKEVAIVANETKPNLFSIILGILAQLFKKK